MKVGKMVNSLCSPAYFYLVLSVVLVALLVVQNLVNGNPNELCVGSFSCSVSNIVLIFVIKALYVAFWTFVLDALCKYGLKKLSWFLVLFPFLLFAVLLGMALLKEL
jgi:hypothetical protein